MGFSIKRICKQWIPDTFFSSSNKCLGTRLGHHIARNLNSTGVRTLIPVVYIVPYLQLSVTVYVSVHLLGRVHQK